MKFFVSYQHRYSHEKPHIENMEVERSNLPTYADIKMIEKEIADKKAKESVGTPQVVVLCCHPIAG